MDKNNWIKGRNEERNVLRDELAKKYNVENNDKLQKCFDLAWQHGHSAGIHEVDIYFSYFVELIINESNSPLIAKSLSEIEDERFEYKGFLLQRLNKDGMWYVNKNNQIVNYGKYRNDLKEWIDNY